MLQKKKEKKDQNDRKKPIKLMKFNSIPAYITQ